MKINLSPINESHIDGILEISNLSFHMPWSRESIENEFRNRLAHYIIAEDENGKVIGYGGVWIVVDEGDIKNIAGGCNSFDGKEHSEEVNNIVENTTWCDRK